MLKALLVVVLLCYICFVAAIGITLAKEIKEVSDYYRTLDTILQDIPK